MKTLMRDFAGNYVMTARDYAESGFYEEALAVLDSCSEDKPMRHYYAGLYLERLAQKIRERGRDCCDIEAGMTAEELMSKSRKRYQAAEAADSACCFPNKLEDIAVLSAAISANPEGAKAPYYLGCLYYDKLQYEKAIGLWEASLQKDGTFPTVLRNLAIAYYNKRGDADAALSCMERAFKLNEKDARVFLELDQLCKKLNRPVEQRLAHYEEYAVPSLIGQRDDLMIEYVTLLNTAGRHQECYDAIMGHTFRPWEGAEGKVSGQFKTALTELAKAAMAKKEYGRAKELLEKALTYPLNLGEGRLEGTKDNNIWYLLGEVKEALGEADAKACYEKAVLGTDEPAGMMYYNDQPADMILYKGLAYEKLGEHRAACACFHKLIDYGEQHIRDEVRIDYFAVSLPDFLIFEDDLTKRNEAHCCYLMGLGNLGLGNKEKAAEYFEEVTVRDRSHQNAVLYGKMVTV